MDKLLVESVSDECVEVVTINGGKMLWGRLTAMGIGPGQKLRKVSRVGMGGPVIVEVDRSQVAIGRGMAKKIVVKALPDGQNGKRLL